MRFLLFPILLICVGASPLESLLARHDPPVRYIGKAKHDLTPLIQWMALQPEVQKRTTKPITQWIPLNLPPAYKPIRVKNPGWCLINTAGYRGREKWIAVKNLPESAMGQIMVFPLAGGVTLPLGETFVTAPAYDFGTAEPK